MIFDLLQPAALARETFRAHQYGARLATEIAALPRAKMALLSLGQGHEALRQALYSLSANFTSGEVIDLGHCPEEPIVVLELLEQILKQKVSVCIIGQADWLPQVQQQAAASLAAAPGGSILAPALPFLGSKQLPQWSANLGEMSFLAYQTYFIDPDLLRWLEQQGWELHRLGRLRGQWEEAEPCLRNSHWASFHAPAIRAADAPAQLFPLPNGLNGEEACLWARYLGMSDQVQQWSIWGCDWAVQDRGQTAQLLAQMIWYWVEGVQARKYETPPALAQLQQYHLALRDYEEVLLFYKSLKSERWWFQIENQAKLYPCSYRDYLQACEGDLPERIWKKLQSN